MKRLFGLVAMLLGLGLLTGLVAHEGAADIARILTRAGLVLCWLVPLHFIPLALDAHAWEVLLGDDAPSLPYLTWVATVREGVNRLLPAANIGGEVVGIRLGRIAAKVRSVVAASVIVEVLLTMVGQYLMCASGVVLTMLSLPALPQEASLVTALLLSLAIPIGLMLLFRGGAVFTRIERLARRLAGRNNGDWIDFNGSSLDDALTTLLSKRKRLARALFWQLAGMVAGAGETWLALLMLGHPVGISAALSIEALTLAIRSVAFFVPGGLGVQEAGIIMLAQLFGINSEVALSLALVRRMREIFIGVPALLSWQWFEARRFKVARSPG
jgi:putative membrane protein